MFKLAVVILVTSKQGNPPKIKFLLNTCIYDIDGSRSKSPIPSTYNHHSHDSDSIPF